MNSSRLNDDAIIRHRIAGRSMRAIAKSKGIALADVNRALDLFTEATFNDKVRSPSSAPGRRSTGKPRRAMCNRRSWSPS